MGETAAHVLASMAALMGPWWRFRVWARLAGSTAYAPRPDAGDRVRPLRPHGYRMSLSQSDWMERYALASGRFYQDDLTALIEQTLREGDVFVDIGANVGFVTLTAARLVGPGGRVVAVEADPATAGRLQKNVELNSLTNVEIHNTALGDRAGSVSMVRETGHHGTNYIGEPRAGAQEVPMVRGDDLLGDLSGRVLVKIDVEGAERLVLDGLTRLLARAETTFIVEICEKQLARFGASAQDIFALMASQGYAAFSVQLPLVGGRIRLRPLAGPQPRALYDVLFSRSATPLGS